MSTPPDLCPRCKMSLNATSYEDVHTLSCGTCSGYWIPFVSLQTILAVQQTPFTVSEKEQAFFPRVPFDVATDGVVPCVVCAKDTSKRTVLGTLLVDVCPGHGVWLDTGELKSIQILTGANEDVRKALLNLVSGT